MSSFLSLLQFMELQLGNETKYGRLVDTGSLRKSLLHPGEAVKRKPQHCAYCGRAKLIGVLCCKNCGSDEWE